MVTKSILLDILEYLDGRGLVIEDLEDIKRHIDSDNFKIFVYDWDKYVHLS